MEAATCASNIMDMDEIENHRPIILHRKLGLLKESKSGDCYHRHGVVCDSHRQIPEPVATGPTLYQPIAMQNFEPVPQLQQACLSIPYGAINTSQQGEVVLLKQQQYCDKFNNYRYSTAHEVVDGSSEVQHLVTVTEQPSLFSVAPLRAACASVCDGGKESVMNESLTTITWLGHMDAQKLVPCTSNLPLRHRQLERGRPPYSYMALIQFAINSSPSRRMTLRQIYNWIQERFPYFKHAKPGWKNSIRHNLSLHDIFVREVSSASKASYWTIQADLNERPLTLDCVTKMPFSHLAHLNEDTEINQNQDRQHGTLMPTDSSTYETSAKTSSLITSQLSPIQPEQTNGNVHFVPSLSSFLVYDKNSAPTPKRLVFSEIQNETQVKKKRRKQPLKTMNDSLNDSLHFNDTLSKSPSDSSPSLDVVYPPHGKAGDISDESGLGASFCMGRLQATPSCQAIMSESHGTSTIKPNRISESMPSTSDADTGLEDCLPQIFDGDTFAFNSSFSRFLNANATSLFNNSAFSTCDFSDIDDASFIQQSKP